MDGQRVLAEALAEVDPGLRASARVASSAWWAHAWAATVLTEPGPPPRAARPLAPLLRGILTRDPTARLTADQARKGLDASPLTDSSYTKESRIYEILRQRHPEISDAEVRETARLVVKTIGANVGGELWESLGS
jgi:hypothetical protein